VSVANERGGFPASQKRLDILGFEGKREFLCDRDHPTSKPTWLHRLGHKGSICHNTSSMCSANGFRLGPVLPFHLRNELRLGGNPFAAFPTRRPCPMKPSAARASRAIRGR
jgi:hypothetical protein